MRLRRKGLAQDKHRNGKLRLRVRVLKAYRKDPTKDERIDIPGPDHPYFDDYYSAARRGEKFQEKPKAVLHSLDWLVGAYLDYLEQAVDAKQASHHTLRQRRSQLRRAADFRHEGHRYGSYAMDAPSYAFVRLRDSMMATPAEADNTMKSLRAMYAWAVERGTCAVNPLTGVGKIHRNRGGATAWTAADLRAYLARHPRGTMAHLYLMLLLFTGCRIGDAISLGRRHEVTEAGQVWLEWQPVKAGSAPVAIPMLPPLYEATRAMTIVGPAYVLRDDGRPFSSTAGLANRFKKWCEQAGVHGLSSHGVRKALASLLSERGMSDAQIGAVMAHTNAQTTAVYTAARNRRVLAAAALSALPEKIGDW